MDELFFCVSMTTKTTRRSLLKSWCRYGLAAGLIGSTGLLAAKKKIVSDSQVWQINPAKCIGCGVCGYKCVKTVSAVKCFHNYKMCGYCDLCTGFFNPQPFARDTGAENQLCPTDAIVRKFVEPPYFEHIIDHKLCVGCGKCVDGCFTLGNGSLFLQISREECLHCNQCSIAQHCPTQAIERIPAEQAYIMKEV